MHARSLARLPLTPTRSMAAPASRITSDLTVEVLDPELGSWYPVRLPRFLRTVALTSPQATILDFKDEGVTVGFEKGFATF